MRSLLNRHSDQIRDEFADLRHYLWVNRVVWGMGMVKNGTALLSLSFFRYGKIYQRMCFMNASEKMRAIFFTVCSL